jgi:hypothetical protein
MAVRKLISPTEAVDRMISGAANAASRWEDGIQNPRRSFKEAALAANTKYKARLSASLAADSWSKGMAGVNESEAIATALARGGASVSTGMAARKDKITRRVTKLFGLLGPHMDKVNSMKTDTIEDAANKMVANMKGMVDIGKQMKS